MLYASLSVSNCFAVMVVLGRLDDASKSAFIHDVREQKKAEERKQKREKAEERKAEERESKRESEFMIQNSLF